MSFKTPNLDRTLLRARTHTGPMTDELVQNPGKFGLGRVPARLRPVATADAVCGFCATGCSLRIHLDENGKAINLSPNPDYPVNLGMACPKGWEALAPLAGDNRATTPLLRRNGKLEPVSWAEAMEVFRERMVDVQTRFGRESVSLLSTGQICTEEMIFLGALAKFGLGMVDIDSNTRQCMATANVAYKQSFGFDAPPYTYDDFEQSDVIVLVGSNLCIAHPILWQRIARNPNQPTIIVIDPRRTETAMNAALHLPCRPRSDLSLFYGLCRHMLDTGRVDRAFVESSTDGFGDFESFLDDYSLERAAEATGLAIEMIRKTADIIAKGKRVSFWWTMGVNQGYESTRTAQAIINLALMTGNIGKPGTGPNSVTGQCNAMGSRLYGNSTSLFGGRDFSNEAHRNEVADILKVPTSSIPTRASRAYDEIIDGIDRGTVHALWVVATNTGHSWINRNHFERIRRNLDFLVVQDMFATTETAQMADLVLPAAAWGEKSGTFINSERRIGVIRKVSHAPGQALSDFAIFRLVAETMGCASLFPGWDSPEAVFQIMKQLSRGQPCDISGIRDYAMLDQMGGIQWPFTEKDAEAIAHDSTPPGPPVEAPFTPAQAPLNATARSARQRRLFSDGQFFTANGRARFFFSAPQPNPEPPDNDYPFLLNTGRGSSAQWHTGTRTEKSPVLRKLAPQFPYVEIHPDDARRLFIEDNGLVEVRSRRGSLRARALVTANVQPGQLFIPMHFREVNRLTFPAFDPHSRQPNYKACAVAIRAVSAHDSKSRNVP